MNRETIIHVERQRDTSRHVEWGPVYTLTTLNFVTISEDFSQLSNV